MRLVLSLLTLTLCAASSGDEIYLQNGDRVSGTLVEITEEAVVVETSYAGGLTISRDSVAGLVTAGPLTLYLQDGGVVAGQLVWGEDSQGFDDGGGFAPLPLETIAEAVRPGVAEKHADATPAGSVPPEEAPQEEAVPQEEAAPSIWSGMVESGLTVKRGNTATTDFMLSAKAVRKTERHELTLKGAGAYGKADNVVNTQRASGEARWQYYTNEQFYVYALGGVERDDGRKLDLRVSTALGAGYDFIESETRTFSADAGLEFTWERWAPYTPWGEDDARDSIRMTAYNGLISTLGAIGAGGVNLDNLERLLGQLVDIRNPLRGAETRKEEDLSLRLGAEYTQKVFERSTLSETLTLYPNLDELGEFRGVSEFAFTTPLSETLKLSISLRTEYDSMADDQGVDPWDSTLVTGLRYEF